MVVLANKVIHWLQDAWQAIQREMQALRGAPFVAALLLVCGALLTLPQGADLVVTAAAVPFSGQSAFLVLAALVYGFECWFWTRLIVERRARHAALAALAAAAQPVTPQEAAGQPLPTDTTPQTPAPQDWQPGFTHRWAPRILGAAPFALAALAIFRAHVDNKVDAWILLALAVVMLAGLRLRRRLFGLPKLAHARPDHGWSRRTQYVSLIGAAAVALLYTLWPVGPAQAMGAISAAYLGAASVTAVMAAVLNWGRLARLPVLGALVVWAVAISPLTDANHAIGRRAFGPTQAIFPFRGKTDLGDAFDAWCRQAACQPGSAQATPIVFVAAEGGASRAGYWAADVLGALQHYPHLAGRFSDHVFAVSAISGGSLGVVDYLATLRDNPDLPPAAFRESVAAASGYDYLSPVIAGMFPDTLQRLVPLAVLPDRAEALERGFEAGWRQHCRDVRPDPCRDHDLLTRPLLSLWSGAGPWMPVLLVGGARQEDGRRVVTSNIWIEANDFPDSVDYHRLTGRDVGLATAISNGARFPAASPGGVIENRWNAGRVVRMGHLLDGGYFDAGGASTMADVSAAVMRRAALRHIKLRPIFIEFSNNSDEPEDAIELIRGPFSAAQQQTMSNSANDDFLTDVLGPFDGIYKTRGSHGDTASQTLALTALYASRGLPGAPTPGPYYLFHLCHGAGAVPMDWALSQPARDAADHALDRRYDGCDNAAKFAALVADIGGK
ncbi:MAG TPA: hypothetical protein VGG29_02220 [Caulobacteraceae bacterium]|jgi:hypothetical protein